MSDDSKGALSEANEVFSEATEAFSETREAYSVEERLQRTCDSVRTQERCEGSPKSDNRQCSQTYECQIISFIERDIIACDVQISLFVSAANSFRYDSNLSPFPQMYLLSDGTKDISSLRRDIKDIPPLHILVKQLRQDSCKLSAKLVHLLHWILSGGQSKLTFRVVSPENRQNVPLLNNLPPSCPRPSLVLEVSTTASERWQRDNEGRREDEILHAFHGSRMDNWYSILHQGLQQHRSKTSLFGQGIYLSPELGVSIPYSSRGLAWPVSRIGSTLSCIALAAVRLGEQDEVKIGEDSTRGEVKDSQGGKLPEKYILVRNNELIIVRYLLVYSHQAPVINSPTGTAAGPGLSNGQFLLYLGYALLLLAIGLANSTWLQRWMRRFFR